MMNMMMMMMMIMMRPQIVVASLSEFDDEIDSYTGVYEYDAEGSSLCTYDDCDSDCSLNTEH